LKINEILQVDFHEVEKNKIITIISKENERVNLEKPVKCSGGVENWLGALLDMAKISLADVITEVHEFLNSPDFRILPLSSNFPSQVRFYQHLYFLH
jgi:dynein heavy chain